jgi:hypothetical protein
MFTKKFMIRLASLNQWHKRATDDSKQVISQND